jgi:hypothetical protein
MAMLAGAFSPVAYENPGRPHAESGFKFDPTTKPRSLIPEKIEAKFDCTATVSVNNREKIEL